MDRALVLFAIGLVFGGGIGIESGILSASHLVLEQCNVYAGDAVTASFSMGGGIGIRGGTHSLQHLTFLGCHAVGVGPTIAIGGGIGLSAGGCSITSASFIGCAAYSPLDNGWGAPPNPQMGSGTAHHVYRRRVSRTRTAHAPALFAVVAHVPALILVARRRWRGGHRFQLRPEQRDVH